MVLVERNLENPIRNGRRSRGPSPNGHGGSPDSSSDEDSARKVVNKAATKTNKNDKNEKTEYEEKIRVGKDFQALIPNLIPMIDRRLHMSGDRALLVWSPTKDIPEQQLNDYISLSKEKFGYNSEQALGMLFWHKHDLEKAVQDLSNFTPYPDDWSIEDKVLFEQAFQFHGKSFHRIRQMLPDKSIASLVKYYYSWKKTRTRNSVIDRQEKIKTKDGSENGSENGSNDDSEDNEDKNWPFHRGIRRASGSPPRCSNDEQYISSMPTNQAMLYGGIGSSSLINANSIKDELKLFDTSSTAAGSTTAQINSSSSASSSSSTSSLSLPLQPSSLASVTAGAASSTPAINGCFCCGIACNQVNISSHGALCNSCFHHWRRTGSLRPTSGPYINKRIRGGTIIEKHKRKPPRGMYINHDDIVSLACPENRDSKDETNNPNDDLLTSMDREISSLLSQVQNNKQTECTLKRKYTDETDDLQPHDILNRTQSRWNNDEMLLAVHGVRKFGRDFQAIAEMMGTKTEVQIRTFFVNYRRKYNLDVMLKEHDANAIISTLPLSIASSITISPPHQQSQPKQIIDDTISISSIDNSLSGSIKRSAPEIMEIDLDEDEPTTSPLLHPPPEPSSSSPSSSSSSSSSSAAAAVPTSSHIQINNIKDNDCNEEVLISDQEIELIPISNSKHIRRSFDTEVCDANVTLTIAKPKSDLITIK